MQKQKLIPEFFLAIQATYDNFEIGLFDHTRCIDTIQEDKMLASKNFILLLESLLRRNQIGLKNLNFIAVNQGPGLFSALRSIITFANALSFAQQLPLVGIDGLKALVHEHANAAFPITVALLNAFNNDVYFAVERADEIIDIGYDPISIFLDRLYEQYPEQKIRFIGNGVELYRASIVAQFAQYGVIPASLPQMVSLQQVAKIGLQKWQQQEISNQLFPLYLKLHPVQVSLKKND
jgi:tRNA threonylcarbamoyladenosine biosynthesis protein TsaB